MSPSSGVSDFTLLERTAQEVVTRCKVSTDQFRDISCEVSSVLFVLKQISKLQNECTLSAEDENALSELCRPCLQSLLELEKLHDKYIALPTSQKRQIDVVRSTTKDVGSIRNKLQSSIALLSALNSALCNAHSSKREIQLLSSRAEILQGMNLIQQEYQDGKRAEPAYSQLHAGEFLQDDNRVWQDVFSELGAVGIRNESTASVNFPFIRDWIREITPAYTAESRSEARLSRVSSWQEFSGEEDDALPDKNDEITSNKGEHNDAERQLRKVSERGQVTTETPSGHSKLDAQSQVMELFEAITSEKQHRSGYVKEVATWTFHSLDTFKKGHLVRFHVEEAFHRANVARTTPIPDTILSTAMKSTFSEQLRRFSLEDFQKLSEKMRIVAVEQAHLDLLKEQESAQPLAREKLKKDLLHMLETDPSKRIVLPFYWEPSTTEAGASNFTYLLDGLPIERDFSFEYFGEMTFCIARILRPRLEQIQSAWTPEMKRLDEPSRLAYERIFEHIVDATLVFYDLIWYDRAFQEGSSFWSDLDIPLLAATYLPNNLSITQCPFAPILEAQVYCQQLFPMIEGILYDMDTANDSTTTNGVSENHDADTPRDATAFQKLPNLDRRRVLRLEDRAREISSQVARWPPILRKLEGVRKWLRPRVEGLVDEIGARRSNTMIFRQAQAKGRPDYQAALRASVEMGETPEIYIPSPWTKGEDIFGRTFYQDQSVAPNYKATIIISSPPRLCVPTSPQRIFNAVSGFFGLISLSTGIVAIVAFIILPIVEFIIAVWAAFQPQPK